MPAVQFCLASEHSIIFLCTIQTFGGASLHTAAMPDEEMTADGQIGTNPASSAVATAAEAAASTALASMLRTSCTIIDMGSYLMTEVRSRPYTADDAALPCIAGEHVRQILPEALVERAAVFPPFDPKCQVPAPMPCTPM